MERRASRDMFFGKPQKRALELAEKTLLTLASDFARMVVDSPKRLLQQMTLFENEHIALSRKVNELEAQLRQVESLTPAPVGPNTVTGFPTHQPGCFHPPSGDWSNVCPPMVAEVLAPRFSVPLEQKDPTEIKIDPTLEKGVEPDRALQLLAENPQLEGSCGAFERWISATEGIFPVQYHYEPGGEPALLSSWLFESRWVIRVRRR